MLEANVTCSLTSVLKWAADAVSLSSAYAPHTARSYELFSE